MSQSNDNTIELKGEKVFDYITSQRIPHILNNVKSILNGIVSLN